jgi:hypothetical protein
LLLVLGVVVDINRPDSPTLPLVVVVVLEQLHIQNLFQYLQVLLVP